MALRLLKIICLALQKPSFQLLIAILILFIFSLSTTGFTTYSALLGTCSFESLADVEFCIELLYNMASIFNNTLVVLIGGFGSDCWSCRCDR